MMMVFLATFGRDNKNGNRNNNAKTNENDKKDAKIFFSNESNM